jgi:hypothetical protein
MIKMLNCHDRHAYTARTQRAHVKNPGKGVRFGNAAPASDSQYGVPLQAACNNPARHAGSRFPVKKGCYFHARLFLASAPRVPLGTDAEIKGCLLDRKTRDKQATRRDKYQAVKRVGMASVGDLGVPNEGKGFE